MKFTRRHEVVAHHPSWTGRARQRARSSRGVTMVEAAFVTPIFLMLFMGVAEGGLYMRNRLGVANTVRAGARTASAAGADIHADLYTVFAIANESTALPRNAIEYVVIYKANGFGGPPTETEEDGLPSGCRNGVPVANECNVYRPADFAKARVEVAERTRHATAVQTNPGDVLNTSKISFACSGTSPDRFWCPTSRENATSSNSGTGPDYVGVYMRLDHEWLTGMFGDSSRVTDQAVVKIEPREK